MTSNEPNYGEIMIECRSPEQIADDDLLAAYEMCQQAINARTSDSYLYVARRRERIYALLQKIEGRISSGDSARAGALSWSLLAHSTIHGI